MMNLGPKQLDVIMDAIADAVFMLTLEQDNQLRFTYINARFVSLSGFPKEYVFGKHIEDVLPAQTCKNISLNVERACKESKEIEWQESIHFGPGIKTLIIKVFAEECNDLHGTKITCICHDVSSLAEAIKEKLRISHQLGERIKELATLQKANLVLLSDTKSKETIFSELINILAAGWQYPEITEASIFFNGQRFCTGQFFSSVAVLSAEFAIPGYCNGLIEVGYTETMPDEQEGPFLQEERDLINMLANKIKSFAERRAVLEQLVNEKELSELMINHLPGIFYLFNADGKFLRWNKNFELVTGYTSAEMLHIHPLDFFSGEEKEIAERKIGETLAGQFSQMEADLIVRNGDKIPYFFNGSTIYYKDQLCLIGFGADISERKRVDLELREAELKFRTLVERSQVGVYVVQRGRLVYLNQRFTEMFGYTIDELMGVSVLETLVAKESRHTAKIKTYISLKGRDKNTGFELAGVKKDGTKNYIEFFAGRTTFNGQLALIGTVLDITERKTWGETLQRSEANLQSIFGATDTCYMLLNKNLKVQSFNQRTEEFMINEMQKRPVVGGDVIKLFPADRQEAIARQLQQALSGNDVIYEINYPHESGAHTWYLVRMFPVIDEEKTFGVMVAVSDITEMRSLQQKILAQTIEEQKKMARAIFNAQEKERAWIGRELHDNVNQLLVSSKLTLGLTSGLDKHNESLVDRSRQLVDDAINEIRALTHEELIPTVKNDLYELITSLSGSIVGFAALKVDFIYDIGASVLDHELQINVYRIIQEAFNNTIKHAEAKHVVLSVKPFMSGIKVNIKDDGKGFDKSLVSHGVGLINIANRVESYNGVFSLRAMPGEGCEMEFIFPNTSKPYGRL